MLENLRVPAMFQSIYNDRGTKGGEVRFHGELKVYVMMTRLV